MYNLPNLLTFLRVAMIPLFVFAFLSDGISNWFALIIFVLAAITDALDGYIARKQHIVTDLGKLMDPLADKLMVMSAFICFTATGILHPAVVIIVMSREFLVTGLRSIASAKGRVIAADIWGKAKTISQDVAAIVILVWKCSPIFPNLLSVISYACVWIMTLLTVFSAVNYCIKNKDIFTEEKHK